MLRLLGLGARGTSDLQILMYGIGILTAGAYAWGRMDGEKHAKEMYKEGFKRLVAAGRIKIVQ